MKKLLYFFLGLGMIFICGCSDDESGNNSCLNNYAEFYYNDTLYRTSFSPGGGTLFNGIGPSCGTDAGYREDSSLFTMRMGGQQRIAFSAMDVVIGVKNDFYFIDFVNDNFSNSRKSFKKLVDTYENYYIINHLDITNNSISGEFSFLITNTLGDTTEVTLGKFVCPYK